jgi:hypothetical protein
VARENAFHGWQSDVYGPNAERISLTGNSFCDNEHSGVYCHKGTDVLVVGNIIARNGSRRASAAVAISMSEGVTVSNNFLEADSNSGVCVGINYPGNVVSDVIIANNICRGASSKTIWIEGVDDKSSLQRIVVSGNVVLGGSYGIFLATAPPHASISNVTVAQNVVSQTSAGSFAVSDHAFDQSKGIRLEGNVGEPSNASNTANLAMDAHNSWNPYIGHGNSPPTQGTWKKGAVIFNLDASPGGPAGWICTGSGIPGTWNSFGKIG